MWAKVLWSSWKHLWMRLCHMAVRSEGIHNSLPCSNSRCWPGLVELTPLYFNFLKPFYSTLMCNQINIKCLVSWEYVWLHFGGDHGDHGDIFQLQKHFGLNSLMFCDCVGKCSFPVPLPGKKTQNQQTFITCVYVFITLYIVLCTYTSIFIPLHLHKKLIVISLPAHPGSLLKLCHSPSCSGFSTQNFSPHPTSSLWI